MKKQILAVLLALGLTGCGAQQTFETVEDIAMTPEAGTMQLQLTLPEEAASPVMENSETGQIYICDGYTITVQTAPAGNLDETLLQTTGYQKENLSVIQTQKQGIRRYDCVWTCMGEAGDQVGRAVILDDGIQHYTVSVMAPAETAGQLTKTWQEMLCSVGLVSTD